MPPQLVWIENLNLHGFGCSVCDWVFKPSDALVGESLEAMKQRYEAQGDKEYDAHVSVKHPRATVPKTEEVAAVIQDIAGASYEHARRRVDQNT